MATGCRLLWLLDPMSSTHNESRFAACSLSGVPGSVSAHSQLILRQVGECVVPLSELDEASGACAVRAFEH